VPLTSASDNREDREAEPGSPANPTAITDPKALRALAHPARIAILQHLALDGPATATECAELAGLSPSACSYHLRALARYGFVEEEPSEAADRRHRPWRAKLIALSIGEDPDQPEPLRTAGRLVLESVRARIDQLRAEYLDRETDLPADWQRAAGLHSDVLHVTPGELAQLRDSIEALISDYRRLAPAERPAGTRRVAAVLDFIPWFDLGEQSD
jgi:DNA-binding transcriptional ArsR family regulator